MCAQIAERTQEMSANPLPPVGALHFGFEGDPKGADYEFWREEFCRRVLVADLVPNSPGPVMFKMTAAPLPLVNATRFEGTATHFIASGRDSGSELALVLPRDVPAHLAMKGRELDLGASDIGLADSALRGADVATQGQGHLKALFVDRTTLLQLSPDAEALIARPLDVSPGFKSLLSSYHALVLAHAHILDAETRAAMAQHLMDLVLLALGAGRDVTEQAKNRGLAAARFEAIKTDILANLSDGALGLSQVAQRHRASPRYVQMLFERSGTTFSEFVVEQRLLLAHRFLTSPLNRSRKISDIAHMAGFGDVSYFHRAVRRRFGATPADVRQHANQRDI
jgi:AraC-like DNA-binding protein